MAKIAIRKKLAANVDATKITFINFESFEDTRILAMMAIEKPPSKELIVMV
jgi:hypothetical protein